MIRGMFSLLLAMWMVASCSSPGELEISPERASGSATEQFADLAGLLQPVVSDTPESEEEVASRGFRVAWRDFWMWIAFFPFRLS
jgi:hypothetical protein